jgi:hypothetical protein
VLPSGRNKSFAMGKEANFFEVLEIEDFLHKQLINRDLVEKISSWQLRKDQNIYETLKSLIRDKGDLYSF